MSNVVSISCRHRCVYTQKKEKQRKEKKRKEKKRKEKKRKERKEKKRIKKCAKGRQIGMP